MPADPKRLKVLKNLQATLQGMSGAAYHYQVTHPSQVTLDPTVNPLTGVAGSSLLFILEPSPDGDKEYYPASQLTEDFIVNITARVEADAADALSKATAWEKLAADLETVLTVDLERGGEACDTRLLTPAPFVGVGSNIVLVLQPVKMLLYRAYKDGM